MPDSNNDRFNVLRESAKRKVARRKFIESIGDKEIDWMGFDDAGEIVDYIKRAINEGKADKYINRFDGKKNLYEHIEGFGKAI